MDNAERPTRYFLRLEQIHQKANVIGELYDPVSHENTKESAQICEIARSFYAKLFKSEPVSDPKIDDFLENVNLPRLQPHLVEACEGDTTYDEARDSLFQMQNNGAPGSDGLTTAFYKQFFHLFGHDYVKMINDCKNNVHKLPESQRSSLIRLICKDIKMAIYLIYYRPISLLNYDYKIIAKMLANRLKHVLSDIINIDQTCSIPGRSIFDNVHLMRDVIEYSKQKDIQCAILSLDKVKAFDRVNHHYMVRVLQKFGFGPDFIAWVQLLYTEINSSVLINGLITYEFLVDRSVRQGCPLSMPLYVVQAEPFSNRIRRDPTIRGLKITENVEIKVSEYADDTNLVLTTIESIKKVIVICEDFREASGAKLNLDKTHLIGLGKWKDNQLEISNIRTVTQGRILGVILGHMVSYYDNWGPILDKVIKSLNFLNSRDVGMRGRGVLANTLSLSKLWYLSTVIQLPAEYLTMLNKQLFKFVWSSKNYEPISRKTLMLKPKEGGLGIVNISLKDKVLKIMHIVRLLTHKDYKPKWVHFAIYWVGLLLRKYKAEFSSNNTAHSCVEFIPKFYLEAKKYFDEYMKIDPNANLPELTVKSIYEKLLESSYEKPKVMEKFPTYNFELIWKNINNVFLDYEIRTFAYLFMHKALPIRYTLHKWNVTQDPYCQMCNKKQLETGKHLFAECEEATKIWPFVKEIYWNLCNHRLKLTYNLIYWMEIPKIHKKKKYRNIVLYFILLAMHSVWKARCNSSLSHTQFTIIQAKNIFVKNFKLRLKVDFYRMGLDDFIERWGKHTILYTVDTNGIHFDF